MRKYLLIALVVLSGCYTERTAQKAVDKAHHKFPLVNAKFCSEKFPPTDSVSIVKEYLQGEDVIKWDTIKEVQYDVFSDTVFATQHITKTVYKTDTLRDTKYIRQENKALLSLKEAEIARLSKDLVILTDSRNDWKRYTFILGGAWLLYLIWRFIKWKFLNK